MCAAAAFAAEAPAPVATAASPSVVVDLNAELSEINPRIYGQFIEHMGRCVYGGIWAEMLQDRKFFYPVAMEGPPREAGAESPWKRTGKEGQAAIGMDTQVPYAGRWSVELAAHAETWAGIRQDELALCEGREYVGRVVAQKKGGTAAALEVRLSWGEGENERAVATLPMKDAWSALTFAFTARKSTAAGALELGVRGGAARIGAVSLMPADNVEGFRADTLALLRTLDAPVYRWPGGNFVSAYNWWEAIGERDTRPPVKNPSWPGLEHHDVGIDEFATLCRLLGTEPLVVVNAGLGSPQMAAALVEYANAGVDTKWGEARAKNGHAKPYHVKWWGIGNEMYGSWQHGAVPLERYVARHKAFAKAMRDVDSSIQIIGVGATGEWSMGMLKECAADMTLLSEHFYCPTDADVLRHVLNMRDAVRDKAQKHIEACRQLFGGARARIPIALDEWNYAWGGAVHEYGDYGVRYAWRDGLGIAAGLCEMIKWRRVFAMANFAQTVNVLGAIKTTSSGAAFEPSALPLVLFRHQFGALGAALAGDAAPLELACGMTEDRTTMTLALVNPTPVWRRCAVEVRGAELSGDGAYFMCASPNPDARNFPIACETPEAAAGAAPNPAVEIETPLWLGVNLAGVPAPPYSVSVWRMAIGAPKPSRIEPVGELTPPPTSSRLLMLYAAGNALYAATSADGLAWQVCKGGAAIATLDGKIDALSACRGENSYAIAIARGNTLSVAPSADFASVGAFKEVVPEGATLGAAFDPCIVFTPEEKKYTLFFAHRLGRTRVCQVSSADLAAWTRREVVLARGYDVRGPALLQGARNFLWYDDAAAGTCRMACGRALTSTYVCASAPLGELGTSAPKVLFDGTRVLLYMARAKGGFQVLASRDLRCWEEVPGSQVALPEGLDAFCFLWADEKIVAAMK
jgi:alpha-N-arabinofuranosidase